MDDNPRQFIDELKSAILRRRVGQIALAIVLAEACIRFLSAIVWYLIIPAISNILEGHTESVLLQSRRTFPWISLMGSTLEFITVIVFAFYVNRWIYGRNRPRHHNVTEPSHPEPPGEQKPAERDDDYEPIVPRLFSAPEAPKHELVPSGGKDHPPHQN